MSRLFKRRKTVMGNLRNLREKLAANEMSRQRRAARPPLHPNTGLMRKREYNELSDANREEHVLGLLSKGVHSDQRIVDQYSNLPRNRSGIGSGNKTRRKVGHFTLR